MNKKKYLTSSGLMRSCLHRLPVFLLMLVFWGLSPLSSQAQLYEWALNISGPGPNVGHRVAVDGQGNVFTSGEFLDSADFDPGPGNVWLGGSPGAERSYLASYTPEGSLNWAFRVADRSPFSSARTLFLDPAGYVYVGGNFFGIADFDPGADSMLLGSAFLVNTYLAKYSTSGELVWVNVFPSNFVLVNGQSAPGGKAVLTGYFNGTVNMDPSGAGQSFTSNGSNDIMLAAYDSNGDLLWANALGGVGEDLGNDLVVDPQGEIILAGTFSNTVNFDPSGSATALSSQGDWDFVMARYDSNGQHLWSKAMGGPGRQQRPIVALGPDGRLSLSGYYTGTTDFDPGAGTASLTSDANGDAFLARYSGNGDFSWVKPISGTNALVALRIQVDGNGKTTMVGFFDNSLQIDPAPGGKVMVSNGGTDAFMAIYGPQGRHLKSSHFGNTGSDAFLDIALDGDNMLHPTGFFTGPVDFDPSADQAILTSIGGFDIVVGKYWPCRTDWVTTTADAGEGSLREVIENACENSTIYFSPALAGDTIKISSGEILIDKNLRLEGLGKEALVISGSQLSRIFFVDTTVTVSMTAMTLTQGSAHLNGGALINQGKLSLYEVDFIGNTAIRPFSDPVSVSPEAFGGAIYSAGELYMEDCRIAGNTAAALGGTALVRTFGGAITNTGLAELRRCMVMDNRAASTAQGGLAISYGGAIYSASILHLEECVVEGNISLSQNRTSFSSSLGGGLYNLGMLEVHRSLLHNNSCATIGVGATSGLGGGLYNLGTATFENSTLSGNSAEGSGASGTASGGGVYNDFGAICEMAFCTVTDNESAGSSPSRAGGLFNFGSFSLEGVILAGNRAATGGPDGQNSSTVSSLGHNLVGDNTLWNMTAAAGDILGTQASPVDPLLGPLSDNGGLSFTHSLLAGSPALDAGPGAGPVVDQRGYYRPTGAHWDIGALESGAEPLIWIADPVEGDSFPYLAEIPVLAQLPSSDFQYLKVTCPDDGFRKLQIANNPVSNWGPKVNVVAGGNDSLKLVLRDPSGDIDWSKIRFYPDGNIQQPVNLSLYLPAGGIGPDWTTVMVPLSAFSSAINFANLGYLEFPFSQQAGPFEIGIREISFVGGANPFLYFGEGKTDNQQNGTGGTNKLTASLESSSVPKIVPVAVDFYANGVFVGSDSTAPFTTVFSGDPAGNYSLVAKALLADGSVFSSDPVGITVRTPEVVIVSPADSSTFYGPASIPLAAEVRGVAGDLAFLQVISPDNNYRKIKLGHNAGSIYGPKVNVTAGGNTHMELTLRDPKGNVDWDLIEIHPQGSLVNPVKIGDYLPAGGPGTGWFSVKIPLSDFASSINFSSISYIEVPYSVKAGPFEIHLQEVKFTGGTTPFLWYGEGKLDNAQDGAGGPGQLIATVVQGSLEVVSMDFYEGSNLIGTDSVAPFGVNWLNPAPGIYFVTAVATFSNGAQVTSAPVAIEVLTGARLAGSTETVADLSAYPNPASSYLKVDFSQEEAGPGQLALIDMAGRTWYRHSFEVVEGTNTLDLDLSGLPAGIYLLTLRREDNGWQQQLKIVKQ